MLTAPTLHLLGSSQDGGAETYFVDLIGALTAAGEATTAAVRAHGNRRQQLEALGVPTEVLPFGGPLDFQTTPKIRTLAKQIQATALVAWMNRAARHTPAGPWTRIGRLGGYYDLKYYKNFDHLVGNTEDIRRYLIREGWPEARAHYIPNFAESQPGAAATRADFDTPQDAPLILGVGRLHDVKAHDVTLRALAELPEAYLWIAGDGPLKDDLQKLAEDVGVAGRVRFLGWRTPMGPFYRAADVVAFPSRFEPLGNVVLQAFAHAVPIVASRAEGPQGLIDDGVDGRLVEIDNPSALAAALRETLNDRAAASALAAAGSAKLAAHFSKPAVIAAWRDLFQLSERKSCAA